MGDRLSVLLIEDDLLDAERVERAFAIVSPTIFKLQHVSRFLDAIQAIKTDDFHVVILDLGLPDSTGLNGVERLMELIPSVPVIVLTGRDNDEEALAGIALGAQEFIDKNSVTPGVLVRSIRHAIKRKQYAIQQLTATGKNSPEAKRLDRLAEIVRETSVAINQSTDSLAKSDLTPKQLEIVATIREKLKESMKAVSDLAPQIETNDEPGKRSRSDWYTA